MYPHETAADPVVTPLLNAGFDIHKLARGRPSSALSVMSREDSSPSSSPRMEESGSRSSAHLPRRNIPLTHLFLTSPPPPRPPFFPRAAASLRMQLHELKHVLRQKNALITSLEQRAGGANTAKNGRSSTPSQGITVAPAVLPRRRTSSLGHAGKSSTPGSPGSGLGLQLDAGSSTPKRSPSPALSASSRRRKNAYDGGVSPLSPPISSVNHLDGSGGLETVKEANRSQLPLGEGFLAPTIASENRRIATLNGAASGSPTSPSAAAAAAAAGGGTGKVIHTLTADLQASRAALDATKAQLRASQRSAGSLQRQHDDLKESLARSRLENETTRQMLARKERQVSECLERARKAESEAKELGRASREWGTRVRDVEAELGDVRRAKGKAEAQYEALASSWRDVRESLQAEVGSLREEMKKSTKQHVDEAKKIVQKQDEVHAAWKERDAQRDGLKTLLDEMTAERERFENALKETVGGLVQRLEVHEQNTARQDGTVEEVHSELKRILRLMRAGESSSAATSG